LLVSRKSPASGFARIDTYSGSSLNAYSVVRLLARQHGDYGLAANASAPTVTVTQDEKTECLQQLDDSCEHADSNDQHRARLDRHALFERLNSGAETLFQRFSFRI
jgi:hypothetical protein